MHDLLGPLVLFAAAMCLTPGPNFSMVTASAANFGFRRTIPQILGIALGFAIMIMAAGLGLAGLFRAEPRLRLVLKYVGAPGFQRIDGQPAGILAGRGVRVTTESFL